PSVTGIVGYPIDGEPSHGEFLVFDSGNSLWGYRNFPLQSGSPSDGDTVVYESSPSTLEYVNLVEQIQNNSLLEVREEGSSVGSFSTLNFIGSLVTAASAGAGVANITLSTPDQLKFDTFAMNWDTEHTAKSTGGLNFTPSAAIFIAQWGPGPSGVHDVGISVGFATSTADGLSSSNSRYSVAFAGGGGNSNRIWSGWGASVAGMAIGTDPPSEGGYNVAMTLSNFDQDGITVGVTNTVNATMMILAIGK